MPEYINNRLQVTPDFGIQLVPKCGTSSLKKAFGKRDARDTKFIYHSGPLRGRKLAVIRQPIERLLSWWRQQVRNAGRVSEQHCRYLKVNQHNLDLNHIMRAIIACPRKEVHYAHYHDIIDVEDTHIITLERLHEQWPDWAPELNLPEPVNTTEKKPGEGLEREVREALEEHYLADVLLWEEALER